MAPLSGFLDDTWFHRTQWRYCRAWPHWRFYGTWPARVLETGKAPKTGQILVFDDSTTYAVRRHRPYVLYADGNDNEPVLEKRRLQPENAPLWSVRIAVRPLAMVQAAETLFIAGPPDTFPEPTTACSTRPAAQNCRQSVAGSVPRWARAPRGGRFPLPGSVAAVHAPSFHDAS